MKRNKPYLSPMKWPGVIAVSLLIGASAPPPPDYSRADAWAALPGRADSADTVPDGCGLKDGQANAPVDVFFIHPTTYYRSYSGNADATDRRLNEFTDDQCMRKQASAFNGAGRVFAPRYRQAALHNFFKRDASKSRKAFDVAYSDVKRAFTYYLENYNEGRPVIIAGHSQGSMHGARLLRDFYDGTGRQSGLVAAYLIGYHIPGDYFSFLPVCDSPAQTGCVVSFNTYGWEAEPRYTDYEGAICVNPLSWKRDEKRTGRSLHQGGAPPTFDAVHPGMVDCKCNRGVLWITKPTEKGYLMMGGRNYHLMDYHLFYMDIRLNAEERVRAYLGKKP